ncbi:MBL fold metallo-hydrolase [Clostridium sp. AM58-1XD]|uniref:MBL fold metallo-hydrolase n=1 Tax=Clostridium sp. AM58-1XD TaxID=2292307 RepID=UPI000E508688|nr:MBL fold metallo-hydrolase [Clostridium sp. AM58-1XD]RGY98097.1 MBL fold metallo-hydrolase [Clostridium sp. AM58-1XD]
MEKQVLSSHGISFRWLNAQCIEFRLPGGRHLLTDPYYWVDAGERGEEIADYQLTGFCTDDLEGADYIILNHTHGDHIGNLKEAAKRFGSKIICHSSTAAGIARYMEVPLTSVYPVDFGDTYYFPEFTLMTFHGEHHGQPWTWEESMKEGNPFDRTEETNILHTIGGIFNMNFLLQLPGGLRIAFVGGNDDGMAKRFETLRPNIIFRNKVNSSRHMEHVADDWFQFMKTADCQIIVPMHHETWLKRLPGFSEKAFADANQMAEEAGIPGRILTPEQNRWYSIQMTVCE